MSKSDWTSLPHFIGVILNPLFSNSGMFPFWSYCWKWHLKTQYCQNNYRIRNENTSSSFCPTCNVFVSACGHIRARGAAYVIHDALCFMSMSNCDCKIAGRGKMKYSSAPQNVALRIGIGQKLHIVCLILRSVTLAASSSFLRVFSVSPLYPLKCFITTVNRTPPTANSLPLCLQRRGTCSFQRESILLDKMLK